MVYYSRICPHVALHSYIQHLLMNAVGGAIALSASMIAVEHICYTVFVVPIADHGNKHIPEFLAGQWSCIAVLGLVPIRGANISFLDRWFAKRK